MHTSSWWGHGEKDLDGNVVADTRYQYQWWRGVHCPMGKEGLDAGLYTIRPGFEIFLGDKFTFKVSSRAVVRHRSGFLGDPTFYICYHITNGATRTVDTVTGVFRTAPRLIQNNWVGFEAIKVGLVKRSMRCSQKSRQSHGHMYWPGRGGRVSIGGEGLTSPSVPQSCTQPGQVGTLLKVLKKFKGRRRGKLSSLRRVDDICLGIQSSQYEVKITSIHRWTVHDGKLSQK